MSQVPHTFVVDLVWLKIPFFLLEIMASRMATSYRPQATQMNEKPTPKYIFRFHIDATSSWWRPTPQEVHACFEVNPLRTWYYYISPNSRTLVILLQVDHASGDEPETVCESCYETEDTSIFAWSSIPDVRHYCWLRGLIHWLFPNTKADYLVHTIQCILNFLQLWIIIAA
jgi:hypothetical protein